jgi:hypothetical protein
MLDTNGKNRKVGERIPPGGEPPLVHLTWKALNYLRVKK